MKSHQDLQTEVEIIYTVIQQRNISRVFHARISSVFSEIIQPTMDENFIIDCFSFCFINQIAYGQIYSVTSVTFWPRHMHVFLVSIYRQ